MTDVMEKRYDAALATRNFEIELFWKRSLFFWGFIASAFVGYATLFEKHSNHAILISCFGFVCSVAWTLVNRGSKNWQENWEHFVELTEDNVTGSLFKERAKRRGSGGWLSSAKYSVSRITIALSDFTVLIWLILMITPLAKNALGAECTYTKLFPLISVLGTLGFVGIMLVAGRSSDAK